MSEQPKPSRYMQELDRWTQENVIDPLLTAWSAEAEEENDPRTLEATEIVCQKVKKAIRGKVLDSYHNGLAKAGQRPRR
jgi:hypothetical protein